MLDHGPLFGKQARDFAINRLLEASKGKVSEAIKRRIPYLTKYMFY